MSPQGDRRVLDYGALSKRAVSESNEPLVEIRAYDPTIVAEYEKDDMTPFTGSLLYVRDTVAKKLAAVNTRVRERGYRLRVVYGYRHPEIQERYFEARKATLKQEHPELDDEALNELTHMFVAVPSVAGHPTGGAVDLTLVDEAGNPLSMGTKIADYRIPEAVQTFNENIGATEREHRLLLRDAMMQEGFAPFNGEWWHFSYGDREWAAFYEKPSSLYGPIRFSSSH